MRITVSVAMMDSPCDLIWMCSGATFRDTMDCWGKRIDFYYFPPPFIRVLETSGAQTSSESSRPSKLNRKKKQESKECEYSQVRLAMLALQ